MTLLDILNSLPVDEPAQAHVKAWADRVRVLRNRWDELASEIPHLLDCDLDAAERAIIERAKLLEELVQLNRKLSQQLSRMHPAPETKQ